MEAVERFRPGFLASTLESLEILKMGFEPTGVDIYFNERAIADDKPTGILEPLEAQFSLIAGMGQGYESEFMLMQLDGIKDLVADIDVLVNVWRAGDSEGLNTLFVEELRREDPGSYEALIVRRNHLWMPIIEAALITNISFKVIELRLTRKPEREGSRERRSVALLTSLEIIPIIQSPTTNVSRARTIFNP